MGLFGREKERLAFLAASKGAIASLQQLGQASTAKGVESLGRLTKRDVRVKEPGASLVPLRALPAVVAPYADAAALAGMDFTRDANGFGALALDSASSLRLVDLLLGAAPGTTKTMGALEESALAETANIALNQMVTAAAGLAGASFRTSVPETSFKPRERLAQLSRAPAGEDHAVVVDTLFEEPQAGVAGRMALVFFVKAG